MALANIASKLTPEEYERKFADINPPLTHQQAMVESARCLFCYDAPCTQACPTHIDVPAFIKKIYTGNVRGAARVILQANVLGHSCGRVCPTEVLCEGACVMNHEGVRPIQIGALQRYAVDHVLDRGIRILKRGEPNGRRVACIGSGPASLGCAASLSQRGYEVVLFDRNRLPGGLNTYGIAAYKTRADDSLREVKMVEELGVEIRQGVTVGQDVSFADLERQFQAIFIGIGLGETWDLKLPGAELDGVFGALDFIERTKTLPFERVDVGRRVAVIGAGNTAIDVLTACRRLNADAVYCVYRRSEAEMPAFTYEFELAKKDGVIFFWQAQPVRVAGGKGVVTGLECVRTRLSAPDKRGRRTPEPIPGTEFTLDVDMVVRAVGQKPVTEFLRAVKGIELTEEGRVVVDEKTGQTGHPKYFAGGDCVNGGREVVDAVAEGMRAARGIEAWLKTQVKPQMSADVRR